MYVLRKISRDDTIMRRLWTSTYAMPIVTERRSMPGIFVRSCSFTVLWLPLAKEKKNRNNYNKSIDTWKTSVLGDEAVAQAAIDAGISGVYAYPGTPSTEITEYIRGLPLRRSVAPHCRWSANEKTAMEAAFGYELCRKTFLSVVGETRRIKRRSRLFYERSDEWNQRRYDYRICWWPINAFFPKRTR